MNEFGEKIKACREKRKMSKQELALKMRVGQRKIEEYESGQHIPSTQTILKLSTVLDIPATELLHHENPPTLNENDINI